VLKLITCKIKSITKSKKKIKVYDIVGVKDNNNFIANNIVTHNCDEAIRFITAENWAKKENKNLKMVLGQVRTKHLLFLMCFPLKLEKVDKNYLESYITYWLEIYTRGIGAVFVKDKNPSRDSWRIKEFMNIGTYNEFTTQTEVEKRLKKHPNFWMTIKFPRPSKKLYERYMKVREKSVYDDENVMAMITKEDIYRALLIMALKDIMTNDTNMSMNRIMLHIKNNYDIPMQKALVEAVIEDAKQLVIKIKEDNQKMD